MTERERRLRRLVQLRERQHDVAELSLRVARSTMASVQAAVYDAQERTRASHISRFAAAAENNEEEWLLACADSAANTLIARNLHTQLAATKIRVQQAAETEATVRLERKQMDATLESVQRECAKQAVRSEQKHLDEVTRLQQATSAARNADRRVF